MQNTLEEKLKELDKNIVGLWKFKRPHAPEGKWCGTYTYGGHYYDVEAKSGEGPAEIINMIERELIMLKNGQVPRNHK